MPFIVFSRCSYVRCSLSSFVFLLFLQNFEAVLAPPVHRQSDLMAPDTMDARASTAVPPEHDHTAAHVLASNVWPDEMPPTDAQPVPDEMPQLAEGRDTERRAAHDNKQDAATNCAAALVSEVAGSDSEGSDDEVWADLPMPPQLS